MMFADQRLAIQARDEAGTKGATQEFLFKIKD
jgi:hypothetical protein